MRTIEKNNKAGVQHASHIEMRSEPRVEVSEFVLVHLPPAGDRTSAISLPAMLTDRSANGLGMILPRALIAGERFTIELTSGEPFSDSTYTVVHCRRMRGGMYALGAKQEGKGE